MPNTRFDRKEKARDMRAHASADKHATELAHSMRTSLSVEDRAYLIAQCQSIYLIGYSHGRIDSIDRCDDIDAQVYGTRKARAK